MIGPKFAEGMNGALFVDLLFACVMFALYIGYEVRRGGYSMRCQAAISILVVLFGDLVLRGWFWWWRSRVNAGDDVLWMEAYPVIPIGMAIEMLGVLCLIRVFAPDAWSRFTWAAVGLTSIAVACLLAFGGKSARGEPIVLSDWQIVLGIFAALFVVYGLLSGLGWLIDHPPNDDPRDGSV